MFQIGEFSKLTQVTIRMLRYYDEIGLLKPAYIDPSSGYRMYAAEQIPILNKIRFLRQSGCQIAEIIDVLQQDDDTNMLKLLAKKQEEIENNILLEKETLRRIETAKMELTEHSVTLHDQIIVKSIPSYHVLTIRKIIRNYDAEGDLWKELSDYIQDQRIACSNEAFSIYHDMDYREKDVDVEICVVIEETKESTGAISYRDTPAVPMMASTMVYGPFSNIATAYLSFAKWLQEHSQYEMEKTSRQIVHRGPWNEDDPQHYLTEIQIPLRQR